MATLTIKGTNQTLNLQIGHFYEVNYRMLFRNRQSETTTPEVLMFLCQDEGYDNTAPIPVETKGFRFINWVAGDSSVDTFWRVIPSEDIIDIKEVAAPAAMQVTMQSTENPTGNLGDLTKAGTHQLTFDNLYTTS